MTKDEALRLSLEAFKSITWVNSYNDGDYLTCNFKSVEQAITAIKAALEAKDEPVAWISAVTGDLTAHDMSHTFSWAPLYTTPPQRKPLTNEEICPWFQENTALTNEAAMRIVRAIEAKLKEKNG